MKKEAVEQKTEALLQPILDANGFELVDVEFVKEGSVQVLRAYIDKPGGIRIDDCEAVSRALSDALDEADFIADAYTLEVSSPGLLRPFRKERDFQKALGEEVEFKLFKPYEGEREFIGVLEGFADGVVTVRFDEGNVDFPLKDISMIRRYIDFSDL